MGQNDKKNKEEKKERRRRRREEKKKNKKGKKDKKDKKDFRPDREVSRDKPLAPGLVPWCVMVDLEPTVVDEQLVSGKEDAANNAEIGACGSEIWSYFPWYWLRYFSRKK